MFNYVVRGYNSIKLKSFSDEMECLNLILLILFGLILGTESQIRQGKVV